MLTEQRDAKDNKNLETLRIDSLNCALNSNAQFVFCQVVAEQAMVAHTPRRLVFAKVECYWHSNYPAVFGLVVHGDDFTIGGGDDFDGLIFSGVGLVTNSDVVFTWEVDPQHAEVGSKNESNKSNEEDGVWWSKGKRGKKGSSSKGNKKLSERWISQ